MPQLIIDAKRNTTYDAIVIGSGISGGWAAKQLCEKGLKIVVLERARIVNLVTDYPTINDEAWDAILNGALTPEKRDIHYLAIRTEFIDNSNEHFFDNDRKNPYTEGG